jgi:hypothetical protein
MREGPWELDEPFNLIQIDSIMRHFWTVGYSGMKAISWKDVKRKTGRYGNCQDIRN